MTKKKADVEIYSVSDRGWHRRRNFRLAMHRPAKTNVAVTKTTLAEDLARFGMEITPRAAHTAYWGKRIGTQMGSTGLKCTYCKRPIWKTNAPVPLLAASKDHIIPQCEGGRMWLPWSMHLPWALRVRNWKWCCQDCNSLRASLGHCVGLMACVVAMTGDRGNTPARRRVVRALNKKFGHLAGPRPGWKAAQRATYGIRKNVYIRRTETSPSDRRRATHVSPHT